MDSESGVQQDLFEVAELPGRPMLHWHGKRPLREIPYYPAQLRERYGEGESPDGWANRLYWGDNLQVMAHLMREFRSKIKLIYIDPPFDSGADYRKRVRLRGTSVQTDLSVLEERQYTDVWSNDLYLQYMYERLILIREMLQEDGSLLLHCDQNRVHHLRCLLDEVFGGSCFCNEIIWQHQIMGGAHGKRFPKAHETILWYAKSQAYSLRADDPNVRVPYSEYVRSTMRQDEDGRWFYTRRRMSRKASAEELTAKAHTVTYVDDPEAGTIASDVWDDMLSYQPLVQERRGLPIYPTQKQEALLTRIVSAVADPGDLVADFFIGSGTTAAVAQQLGRRWIGADMNLGAVNHAAHRLASILEEQQTQGNQLGLTEGIPYVYRAFEVYNVNQYDVFKNADEARDIVLQLYGVEPLRSHRFFDGILDDRLVKVIDLNRICSKLDIQSIFDNLVPDDTRGVVVLCSGHEYDVPEAIRHRNVVNIPFELRDILTDRKDVIFKRPPEAQVSLTRSDGQMTLTIEQFYSPLLLQKLSLEDAPDALGDWRQMVSSVLIDPEFDGDVFHPRITDIPGRQEDLVRGVYRWDAAARGQGQVAVKIVDVLDEEWFRVVEAQ